MRLKTLIAYARSFRRAAWDYGQQKVRLSRTYDALMRRVRGYGSYSGADRKGYPFIFYWRMHTLWKRP